MNIWIRIQIWILEMRYDYWFNIYEQSFGSDQEANFRCSEIMDECDKLKEQL